MTMKKLDLFATGAVEQTLWAAHQMIGENIALNKDPLDWVMFFATFSEEYGRL